MNGLLLRSLEEKLPLEVIYLSEKQQISQRKMIIKEINNNTVRAYCLLRHQVRTFRMENILSVMPEKRLLH
ncbi:WYL domain-containing protein [Neobacillus terrae]|uniref:WYL domain-containing protein n=1 Tax=Neobacillus terrae TaxID=3034837 RepID=UPI00140CCED9|nr:WYL domain-containing protein [Neobacillus terrae]NHM32999.1 WYL domain-containing protein [Neobacillus terrae]